MRRCIAVRTGMKQNDRKEYIAVTGGIGSGKSTVMHMIADLGYPVLSADEAARNIYEKPDVRAAVVGAFPECADAAGNPDRKLLAGIVFSDKKRLDELNAITHPAIMRSLFAEAEKADGKFVFFEIPLLFEGGYENLFDRVIVVMRDKSARIRAVSERDGLTESEVGARISNQFDYEKKCDFGHTVIYNEGDISSLYTRVREVVNEIISEKG